MKRILLVESDSMFSKTLKTIMEKSGHAVTFAKNGKEAFKSLKQKTYDLVVTDLMLEYVTGAEIIDFVKKNTSTPIAVLSSITNKESVAECIRSGADAYISKPLNTTDFVNKVNGLLHITQTKAA